MMNFPNYIAQSPHLATYPPSTQFLNFNHQANMSPLQL